MIDSENCQKAIRKLQRKICLHRLDNRNSCAHKYDMEWIIKVVNQKIINVVYIFWHPFLRSLIDYNPIVLGIIVLIRELIHPYLLHQPS